MKINPIIFMGLSLKTAMGIGLEKECGTATDSTYWYECDADLACVPL